MKFAETNKLYVSGPVACTAIVCATVFALAVAGEPDLLDTAQAHLLLQTPVPGFCQILELPVAGVVLGGTQ